MAYDIIIGRSEEDKKLFGKEGTVFLGKTYVQMGRITSLANPVYLDVARNHTILVCGKRGCLTEDTFIFTDKGYKEIKKFNENKDKIYSFNKKNKKFELERAKLISYDINEELYEITLKDGQELIATAEHPFLVKSNKFYSWKIASEITVEDKIVSLVNLPETKNKEGIGKEMARLLGFILADGNLFVQKGRFKDGKGYWYNGTKKRLRIFNAQEEVLICAKKDLEKIFNIQAKRYKREKYNHEVIETKQQRVVDEFVKLGIPVGKKDSVIRVPKKIFSSPKSTIAQFLKALISCDGTVDKKGSRIQYYSNSNLFLKDLQLLLSYFGIHGRVRNKKVTCNGKKFLSYVLDIMDYSSLKIFEKKISLFSEEKRSRLKKRNFWRIPKRKSTEYISENLFFEPLTKISKKRYNTKVYDLRVPKNHSFIANGIISHNSGKSYSMGVMTEGVIDFPEEVKNNMSIIIFDTMGIFWTMKYKNEKDEMLLEEWGLDSKGLDIDLFVPKGYYQDYKSKGIPADYEFGLQPRLLNAADWCGVFNIDINSDEGVLIARVLKKLSGDYSVNEITYHLEEDQKSDERVKERVQGMFISANTWGLFDEEAVDLSKIAERGRVNIIDLSCYGQITGSWSIKSLVAGIVGQKLLADRIIERKREEVENIERGYSLFRQEGIKSKLPLLWIFIDEAHNFLPKDKETPATNALISLLREGRQPGISMVLATQQPGKVHDDVITQSDIVLCHRITASQDMDALNSMMQSYMEKGLTQAINDLPKEKGAGVILDDVSERIYPLRVRPRISWHGGEAPSALKGKKSLELGF